MLSQQLYGSVTHGMWNKESHYLSVLSGGNWRLHISVILYVKWRLEHLITGTDIQTHMPSSLQALQGAQHWGVIISLEHYIHIAYLTVQTQTGRKTNTQHVQDDKAGRQKYAKADLHTYILAHGPTWVTVTSLHVDTHTSAWHKHKKETHAFMHSYR